MILGKQMPRRSLDDAERQRIALDEEQLAILDIAGDNSRAAAMTLPPYVRWRDDHGVTHWTGLRGRGGQRVRCCDGLEVRASRGDRWSVAQDDPITCIQCLAWEVNLG